MTVVVESVSVWRKVEYIELKNETVKYNVITNSLQPDKVSK